MFHAGSSYFSPCFEKLLTLSANGFLILIANGLAIYPLCFFVFFLLFIISKRSTYYRILRMWINDRPCSGASAAPVRKVNGMR
jgi:hypothetical protein